MNAKRRLEELLLKMSIKQGYQDQLERLNDSEKELCQAFLKIEEKKVKHSL